MYSPLYNVLVGVSLHGGVCLYSSRFLLHPPKSHPGEVDKVLIPDCRP